MPRKKNKSGDQYAIHELLSGKESEGEVVENIRGKIARWENDSRESRRQWLLNAAFARGQHFNVFARTQDRLVRTPTPPGRKQITDDMVGEWKLRQVANMTTAMPRPSVIPNPKRDRKSVTAARYGEALLDYYRDEWRFIERYIALCGGLIDFGNMFGFYNYIEDIKRETAVATGEDNEPIYDGTEPIIEQWMVGDIVEQFIYPHQLAVSLDSSPLHEKMWAVLLFDRSLDYMIGRYGDAAKEIQAVRGRPDDTYDLYNIASSKPEQTYGTIPTVREEIYLQPPSETEDGLYAVVSGNTFLKVEKWPHQKLTHLPIVHYHLLRESDEFYARSPIEQQIPLQRLVNLLWCVLAENAEDMAHQKTLLPDQGYIDTPSNLPEVIRYTYPFVPSILAPAPMPDYVAATLDRAKAALRDRQFSHGASIGTAVSGVRSDAHAQNLQDQDLLPLSVADSLLSSAFARAYEIILVLAAEKLTDDRTLNSADKNGRQVSMANFKGAMLGDVQRVKVRMMNANLRSPNAVKQDIFNWFNAGMITDNMGIRRDPMKAMRQLEFALPESIFEDYKIHSNRAYQENDRLMRGEPVMPYDFQHHPIHLTCHDELRNSDEYMAKKESKEPEDQQIVVIVDEHINATMMMYQTALQAMMPPQPEEGEDVNQKTKSGSAKTNTSKAAGKPEGASKP